MKTQVRSLRERLRGHGGGEPAPKVWTGQTAAPKLRAAFTLLTAVACVAWADGDSLSSDDMPPLRPPRAEIPPTFWQQHQTGLLAGGLFLLLLSGLVVWLLLRPRQRAAIPPAASARQALEPLRNQPENGWVLSKVSQVIRWYFAAAFKLPPGELTTTEFAHLLIQQEAVGPQLAASVNDFLQKCDQRKFAPLGPLPPLGAVSGAAQLIDQAEARRSALEQVPARP